MRRVSAWIDARAVPLIVTMVLAVAGAAYSFFWLVAARHGWQSYSDLWNSAGLALGIGHGHFASVYSPSSYLDSPPGLEFLLAPVMVVGHAAGARDDGRPEQHQSVRGAARRRGDGATGAPCSSPSMRWLDSGSTPTRGASRSPSWPGWASSAPRCSGAIPRTASPSPSSCGRRSPSSDAGPGGFAGRAGCSASRWRASRWRSSPWRRSWRAPGGATRGPSPGASSCRARWSCSPSSWRRRPAPCTPWSTSPSIRRQESATPFSHLARSLGHGMYSGGTLRLVATVVAVVVGWVACRRRHDLPFVLFVMAIAFTLRVVFESELLGFYFFPVVALCLLLSLRSGWARFDVCAAVSLLNLALGNRREHDIALWWPAMMATVLVLLVLAYASLPAGNASGRRATPRPPPTCRATG